MRMISNGEQITVKPSKGKYLRLKVDGKTAEVVLFVPRGVTKAQAEAFALSKAEWIAGAKERVMKRLLNESLSSGFAPLFGFKLPIVYGARKCCIHDGKIYLNVCSGNEAVALKEVYKQQLAAYITQKLPYFEGLTGLKATGWRLREMTSRWGSCNTVSGVITFSIALAKKSPKLIDYVILHELAHLIYPNHQAGFKAYLSKYMPEWKKYKKRLNEVYENEN